MRLQFSIFGDAIPQGSLKAFVPKGSRARLKSWRILVADAAQIALLAQADADRALALGGVRLQVVFHLPRPQSLPKKVTAHRTRPDLDRLVRAVSDALTSVCYRDDSQICEVIALKRYAAVDLPARVDVLVEDTAGTATGIRFVDLAPVDALPLLDTGTVAH